MNIETCCANRYADEADRLLAVNELPTINIKLSTILWDLRSKCLICPVLIEVIWCLQGNGSTNGNVFRIGCDQLSTGAPIWAFTRFTLQEHEILAMVEETLPDNTPAWRQLHEEIADTIIMICGVEVISLRLEELCRNVDVTGWVACNAACHGVITAWSKLPRPFHVAIGIQLANQDGGQRVTVVICHPCGGNVEVTGKINTNVGCRHVVFIAKRAVWII